MPYENCRLMLNSPMKSVKLHIIHIQQKRTMAFINKFGCISLHYQVAECINYTSIFKKNLLCILIGACELLEYP